jgi:protein-S-isoprenylcysteine O-methyltransferase Ste14
MSQDLLNLDIQFLARVERTTLQLGLVLSLMLVQTLQFPLVGGFASGVLIGALSLRTTMWAVDSAFNSNSERAKWIPAAVLVAKLGIICGLLRLLVGGLGFSILSLACGLTLVFLVISLKIVGIQLTVRQTARGPQATSEGRF